MGRLVRKPQVPEPGLHFEGLEDVIQSPNSVAPTDGGDSYLERMVKYVPAEVIAGSMVINAILGQSMEAGGQNATMAGVPLIAIADAALVVGLFLSPLFCWYVREDGDAWIVNALVSTVAFPLWAYLMGAVSFANHHDGNFAAILVLTFTAVSGLVSPRARKPKRRRDGVATAPKEGPRLVGAAAG